MGHRLSRDLQMASFELRGISLAVRRGESVAILGGKGAGKTSLLALLTGLDEPDSGFVCVAGYQINNRSEAERARLRAEHIGVIYTFGNLLDHLTIAQNIVFVQRLAGRNECHDIPERLAAVDLVEREHAVPAELSGGERSRAALAVPIANDPPLIVADEPTASLNAQDGSALLSMLLAESARGAAVVLATSSLEVAERCDRVVELQAGQLRRRRWDA